MKERLNLKEKVSVLKYHRVMWKEISDMFLNERVQKWIRYELDKDPSCLPKLLPMIKKKAINNKFPDLDKDLKHNCFMCEYAKGHCSRCPILWTYLKESESALLNHCMDIYSPYYKLSKELLFIGPDGYNFKKLSRLALDIAELPERRSSK